MEPQITHSEIFILQNKASTASFFGFIQWDPKVDRVSQLVCVLIIKRLIWYLFMFVFSFDVGCLLLLSGAVSVAISGSLLTPRVWCLPAHLTRVTNCPHQQTSPGYKSGAQASLCQSRPYWTPVIMLALGSVMRDWLSYSRCNLIPGKYWE